MNKRVNKQAHRDFDPVRIMKGLLVVMCLVLLLLLVVFLVQLKSKGEQDEKPVSPAAVATNPSNLVATTIATTAAPPPPAPAKSVSDPARAAIIDKYFGPLPVISERKEMKPHEPVRGIYIANGSGLDAALALCDRTEVNAVVIDAKESFGLNYHSNVPLAQTLRASVDNIDLKTMIDKCHQRNVRAILRVVCFKDEIIPKSRQDLCIRDQNGTMLTFSMEGGLSFASPYNKEVWQYLIDLSNELIDMGADEIQFDYVRFPTGKAGNGGPAYFGPPETTPSKDEAINRFLETARILIQEKRGIPVGADLFPIIMASELDGQLIGQKWKTIGLTGIHNICPMVYPSHYANSSNSVLGNGEGSYIGNEFFPIPDKEPYKVVLNALNGGKHGSSQPGFSTLRPYLQAFTASYLPDGYYINYGPQEIRQQIQGVYDAGFSEWILWNAGGKYDETAFKPKGTP